MNDFILPESNSKNFLTRRCFISNFFEGHVIEIGERIGEIDPGQMKGQVGDRNGQDPEIAKGEILIEIEER